MKNHFFYLPALVAMSMCVGLTACGDDDPGDDTTGNGGTPTGTTATSTQAMSPKEQKAYLDEVAQEFLNQLPADEFTQLSDLANYISETYFDDYNWNNVETWGRDILDNLTKSMNKKTSYKDDWGTIFYDNYSCELVASNFTGHFTAKNGKWVYSDASDLQFIFTDKKKQECVLSVTTSGNVVKVHAFNLDITTDYDWYNDEEYKDRTQYTIGVPEKIIITLTQGGNQVFKNTVTTNISSLTAGQEFDISGSKCSVTEKIELNNGYTLNVSKASYSSTSASAVATMTKNGTTLFTASASSDLSKIPSVNASAFTADFDEDEYDFDDANVSNTYVKLDILGKVQMQGSISDVTKFSDYLDKADDNDENEGSYKSYIGQANGLMSVFLYYKNSNVKQAQVTLEPFEERGYSYSYWTYEPILNFFDGSTYSTFEAFFNDTDFKALIDLFEDLVDDYDKLID
jgi:hypothetical protein